MGQKIIAPSKVNYWRIAAALFPGILICVLIAFHFGPTPQPQSYHHFADQRTALGIPHAGDVLTNLAFIVVGLLGVAFLLHPRLSCHSFIDRRERWAFICLFTGMLLTGFGSAWYHLAPDNDSLVWDRLPMALAFMGLFAAMLTERINILLGYRLLGPLILLGIASVLWWIWTEHQVRGDMRWYLTVQFYPMITIPLMIMLLPSMYTRGNDYWVLFAFYATAKVVEVLDKGIFTFTHGLISGHSIKHLAAAAGVAWIIRMLWLRRPRAPEFRTD